MAVPSHIGDTNFLCCAPVFCLVDTRTNGTVIARSLPAELGPLPLYLDDDGFYSVLGPRLCNTVQKDEASGDTGGVFAYGSINISTTLTPRRAKVFCGSSRCSGNRSALFHFILVLGIH